MPLRSTGKVYYFCDCQDGRQDGCVPGDDANYDAFGCDADHPCQTWMQATKAFNAMNGGDTVALCKGGVWKLPGGTAGTGYTDEGCADCGYAPHVPPISNPRCAKGTSLTDLANRSTCDIRDYAPSWGGTAKPVLAPASSNPTRWINRYGGGTNGVRILNLVFQGGNAGPNGGLNNDHRAIVTGYCNTSFDSDWLICNNTFDRLRLGMNLANGHSTYSNFLIAGNRFTMNDLDALLLGNGDRNRIDANFFDNNGGFTPHPATGNAAHSVYLSGDGVYNSTNMWVVNNEFRRSSATSTAQACATGVLVGHEYYDGVNVENNIIDAGAGAVGTCWGVDLRASGSPPTHYRHMTFHRNWVNGGGAGIVVGQAPGVLIENNVVTLTGPSDWKQGIMSPQDAARPGQDDVQNDTTIRNNTIYITGANDATNGILVGTEGSGHVIANNAVFFDDTSVVGTCFATPLDSSAYSFVGNNACHGGSFLSGTAYDAIATRVTADPKFTSAPADFTPAVGSPLIGAGTAAHGAATDFTTKTRPSPPSIGAYEP